MRLPGWFIGSRKPSLDDRRLLARCTGAALILALLHHATEASDETLDPHRGRNKPGVSQTQGTPISVEELARRLQKLEQQNANLAEQNQRLIHQLSESNNRSEQQNAKLAEQNQRLDQQLKSVTSGALSRSCGSIIHQPRTV
jgi:septal ring factor EnvC (AmiA/AmiB activator)